MSEPWGPHDVGGLPGGPIDTDERENTHWDWQVDAMVRLVLRKGLISDFAELRDGIEQLTPEDYGTLSYYERWAKSLAYTLVSRGIVGQEELDAAVDAVRRRQQEGGAA